MDKMNDGNLKPRSKSISLLHLIYVVIICLIIMIFVLCIAPGRINQYAYDNFAFAATITSIVLAVVSIVYSLQSGLSSVGQLNSIREIENQITAELAKFTGIEDAIKKAINPISQQVGDIQKSQDEMHDQMLKLSERPYESTAITDEHGGSFSEVMCITLYAAALSKDKDMDLPFHIFEKYLGAKQTRYCEGLLDGISSYNPDKLRVTQGSFSLRRKVDVFNINSTDFWRSKIQSIEDEKLATNFVKYIDHYYSDKKNQLPRDTNCIS
jgi:hypothetical protein